LFTITEIFVGRKEIKGRIWKIRLCKQDRHASHPPFSRTTYNRGARNELYQLESLLLLMLRSPRGEVLKR